MIEMIDTFSRVENKYLMNREQAEQVMQAAQAHLKKDLYFQYTIHNIYYDTEDSAMIINSLEKPNYREKLRLRSYGEPNDSSPVFLEIKKKYQDIVYKRRIALKEAEAYAYLDYGIPHSVHSQIADEIDYLLKFYNPEAKLLIVYDRTAWAASSPQEPDVRITFDQHIRYRTEDLSLRLNGQEKPLFDQDLTVMEIKAMDRYPIWLTQILSNRHLYLNAFSKYGRIYTGIQQNRQPRPAYRPVPAEPETAPAFAFSLKKERGILHV